jgi:hypothetical protein
LGTSELISMGLGIHPLYFISHALCPFIHSLQLFSRSLEPLIHKLHFISRVLELPIHLLHLFSCSLQSFCIILHQVRFISQRERARTPITATAACNGLNSREYLPIAQGPLR